MYSTMAPGKLQVEFDLQPFVKQWLRVEHLSSADFYRLNVAYLQNNLWWIWMFLILNGKQYQTIVWFLSAVKNSISRTALFIWSYTMKMCHEQLWYTGNLAVMKESRTLPTWSWFYKWAENHKARGGGEN